MTHDNGAAGAADLDIEAIQKRISRIALFGLSDLSEFFDDWAYGWAEFMVQMPTDILALIAEVERLRSALRAPQPQEAVTFATLTSVDGSPVAAPGTPFNGICTINEQVQSAALRAPQEGKDRQ